MATANLPFDEWTEVFGPERLTGALLDRLTHHMHILEMNGENCRLKRSRENAATQASEEREDFWPSGTLTSPASELSRLTLRSIPRCSTGGPLFRRPSC